MTGPEAPFGRPALSLRTALILIVALITLAWACLDVLL